LVKVAKNNEDVASYVYDESGLRLKKQGKNKAVYYVFDTGGNVLYEQENREYLEYVYVLGKHFARVDGNVDNNITKKYFYHTDHLGSTVLVTDEQGKQVYSSEYTPFGEQVSKEGELAKAAKFTGKDLDEDIGLYYFNARWMDPEIGRFISEDPLAQESNLYSYCGSNPLNRIDPSGMEWYNNWDDFKSMVSGWFNGDSNNNNNNNKNNTENAKKNTDTKETLPPLNQPVANDIGKALYIEYKLKVDELRQHLANLKNSDPNSEQYKVELAAIEQSSKELDKVAGLLRENIANYAIANYQGIPYAHNDPSSHEKVGNWFKPMDYSKAFRYLDCSDLTGDVYNSIGIIITDYTDLQYSYSETNGLVGTSASELKVGDLVFLHYDTNNATVVDSNPKARTWLPYYDHVMFVTNFNKETGEVSLVQAYNPKRVSSYSPKNQIVTSGFYYSDNFSAYGRLIQDSADIKNLFNRL